MHSPFAMMAAYNAWANRRLYDAAAALPDADYRADRGAFFKSVHGTLNHLLVADRIWMRRFTGEGEHPNRLDAILFEDLPGLRAAREAEDERIARYIDGLTDADLAGRFRYRTITNPRDIEQPLAASADAFLQPPDPPPRPGALPADRLDRHRPVARPPRLPARDRRRARVSARHPPRPGRLTLP